MEHGSRTPRGDRLQKPQVGPLRLHLLGGRVIVILTLYVDYARLLGKGVVMVKRVKQKLMDRLSMTDMGEMSLLLGIGVTRYREKRTVIITHDNYTNSLLERYGMGNCNPMYPSSVGGKLSLDQPEEKLLIKGDKQHFTPSWATT